MTTKTAKHIKDIKSDGPASQALYKLDPPLEDYDGKPREFVVVSAVTTYSGPETYLFPANESGKIVDWGEMGGSYRGGLSHQQALENAGYTMLTK